MPIDADHPYLYIKLYSSRVTFSALYSEAIDLFIATLSEGVFCHEDLNENYL